MPVTFRIFPGSRLELIIGKTPAKVAAAEIRDHIGHTAICNRDLEAVIMTDQPVGHKATVAAASDTHTLLVNVVLLQQYVDTCHNIQRVFLAPGSTHRQGKIIAIATTP